jgi:bile acid:Na+ symporter, BASS family
MLAWCPGPGVPVLGSAFLHGSVSCTRITQPVRSVERRRRSRVLVCCEHPVNPSAQFGTNAQAETKIRTAKVIPGTLERATSLFPVWVAGGAALAAVYPPSFLWFSPKLIVLVLGIVMAGMGLTLSEDDFRVALSRPRTVLLGVVAQYSIMPILGYALARILALPADLAVGVILVAVCPGGAASNLVCLIGKADVALSVVLTLCSTLLAVIAIPTWMKLLAGTIVPISAISLMASTGQVVIVPLLFGYALRKTLPSLVERATTVLSFVSVLGVMLICGSIVARNAGSPLGSVGPVVVLALALLHGLGGLFGFVVARLFSVPTRSARTISIEVMMQNSSLAVALAMAHFSSPLAAVPGFV